MDILVTGASGQLAFDLVPALKGAGMSPIGMDAKALDITERERAVSIIREMKPKAVVNCAAYTKVDLAEKERQRAFAVNRDGAANIAEACALTGAALIHISTDFVFDGKSTAPYRETDATGPISIYGESKLAGEEEIRKRLPHHYIIRTSWLYGAHGHNFVKTILRLSAERESLRVVYDQTGTPTWTGDLAAAITTVLKNNSGGLEEYGTYHYSNEGVASWYDFAEAIIKEAPRGKCVVFPILTAEYPTPARRPAYSVLDKEKIKKAFGLNIPYWRDSLAAMLGETGGVHA